LTQKIESGSSKEKMNWHVDSVLAAGTGVGIFGITWDTSTLLNAADMQTTLDDYRSGRITFLWIYENI
jgi:hypothetical protein